MPFTSNASALLLIDIQQRLMPAIAGGADILANAGRLASAARILSVPVLATEQNPAGLGESIAEIRAATDRTFVKRSFDATREATWPGFLPPDRPNIIIAGCEAHVCVMQTALSLQANGVRVHIVADAVGSRTTANRDAALQRMRANGIDIVTSEMVIFEWLGTCDHPHFREVIGLVKQAGQFS
jgi:nicotinamidase-related amidase